MTLEYAREMAQALAKLLAPACEKIMVAGSIRRQKARPNDIELVAVPRWDCIPHPVRLWDNVPTTDKMRTNLLDARCDELLKQGVLEKRPDSQGRHCWGTGVKRAIFYQGKNYAPVDLFQVVEPAQWGVIFAIRTGPGDFNRLLVTSQRFGGACPEDRKVAGGRVWQIKRSLPERAKAEYASMPATKFAKLAERGEVHALSLATPEEWDFFFALDVPWWPSKQRTLARLQNYIRGREQ